MTLEPPKTQIQRQVAADWEEATISDGFIFNRVMTDQTVLLHTLQCLRPDLRVKQINQPIAEFSLKQARESRGYRLDVFVSDEAGREFDIEMQVVNYHNLMERSLTYMAAMVEKQLEVGDEYNQLRPVHVIFLTKFDPLGKKRQYDCQEFFSTFDLRRPVAPPLVSFTFIDVTNDQAETPAPVRRFCNFINRGTVAADDPFILELKKRETYVKQNAEWRETFMRIDFDQKLQEWQKRREIAESHERGLRQGQEQERQRAAQQAAQREAKSVNEAIEIFVGQGEPKNAVIDKLVKIFSLSRSQAERYYQDAMKPA